MNTKDIEFFLNIYIYKGEKIIIHKYIHRYLSKIDKILYYISNKIIKIRCYKNKNK